MARECPSCGMLNPDSGELCDCGFSFTRGMPPKPTSVAPIHDPTLRGTVRTFTYKRSFGHYLYNGELMDKHIQNQLAAGWEIIQSGMTNSHLNVGRTAAAVLTLGVAGLLFNSRTDDTITVTFRKT